MHSEWFGRRTWLYEIAAVTAITAAAAFLRFYSLDTAPPGFYHDESIYGVLGAYVYHGNRDIYFGEREGLFMYLLAAGMRLWGHDIMTLHTVVSILGTATVPVLYVLARLLFGWRVATLAAIGLATSFWHVSLSRVVFRAMTLPLFETIALGLLWGALRARRPTVRVPLFALAGASLGLVLYTYIAARMVPFVVLLFLLSQLALERKLVRPAWLNLPLYTVGAGIVFLPLGIFMLQHPSSFLGRMGEVAVAGSEGGPVSYLTNALRVAGMFFVAGDANWRHNFAGRPVFDPVFAVAFVLGLWLCLLRWRQAEHRFLLIWAIVMLVPTAAAIDAPHFLRANGVLPAIYVLAALGFARGLDLVARRLPQYAILGDPRAFAAFAGVMLALSGVLTFHTYFSQWLPRAETYFAFDGPHATLAEYLAESPAWRASATGKDDHFVSQRFWQDRTAMMYRLWPWISGRDRDDMGATRLGSRWLEEEHALPIRDGGATYLLSQVDSWAAQELRRLYGDSLTEHQGSTHLPGVTAFVALTAPARGVVGQAAAPVAVFGGALALQGVQLPPSVLSGTELAVTTRWQVTDIPREWLNDGRRASVFVHLLDYDGSLLAAADGLAIDPSDWRRGEGFILRNTLRLPVGTVPGQYKVILGVVAPDGKRVGWPASPEGIVTVTDSLAVTANPNPGLPNASQPSALTVGDRLQLLGLNLTPASQLTPGQGVRAELFWLAKQPIAEDLNLELSLVDGRGSEYARLPSQPLGGRYPTSRWGTGEVIRDAFTLSVSARAPAGQAEILLSVIDGAGNRVGPLPIANVTVAELPRVYDPPAGLRQAGDGQTFGGVAALAGYIMQPESPRPGEKQIVTLYWRSLAEVDERYKVFVHLVGSSGLVAQSDAEPAAGARPVSSWVAGEVVKDEHALTLPGNVQAGEYTLQVGFYDPRDGKRLSLQSTEGGTVDDKLILGPFAVSR